MHVTENPGQGTSTVTVPFTTIPGTLDAPIDCASVAIRGNGVNGTLVTVRTSTGQVREAFCTTETFPTVCGNFTVLGTVPMSMTVSPAFLRSFAASHGPAHATSNSVAEGSGPAAARSSLLW
jgi:hypothetical protein